MAATTDFTLTNDKDGYQFLFRGVAPAKISKNQPTLSIPFVGTSSDNNMLFRFTGQTEVVNFTFALFDDDTDVSNGTAAPSSVKTVNQQIDWLMNSVYGDDFDVSWTLTDSRFYPGGVTVNIESIEIENQAGGISVVMGTITLKRGRLGSL